MALYKKIIISIALLISCLSMNTSTTQAAQNIIVKVDGKQISFPDQAPYIKDGHVMVPVTAPMEAMGCEVQWTSMGCVYITKGKLVVDLDSDSGTYLVNGQGKKLEAKPEIKNNRVVLPIRSIVEAMAGTFEWDASTNTVNISSTGGINILEEKVTVDANGMLPRTIGANDPMFEIVFDPYNAGTRADIVSLSSKDGKKYRWSCTNYDEMNVYYSFVYSTGKPSTYRLDKHAYTGFSIVGGGDDRIHYDMIPEPGMTLTYNVYDEWDNLVRIVDFKLLEN